MGLVVTGLKKKKKDKISYKQSLYRIDHKSKIALMLDM